MASLLMVAICRGVLGARNTQFLMKTVCSKVVLVLDREDRRVVTHGTDFAYFIIKLTKNISHLILKRQLQLAFIVNGTLSG